MKYKKYFLYILRWVIFAIPGAIFFDIFKKITGIQNLYIAMLVSQGILGALVYFVDKRIFGIWFEEWEVTIGKCVDCDFEGEVWRLRKAPKYDRVRAIPEYRCKKCSEKKCEELKKRGVFTEHKKGE